MELSHEYYTYQDTAKELEISLEEKNRRLIQNQDDKIHLATLQERNRIAKEIHDNTGHLLSRSLLQIGALMIITKDKVLLENLKVLKDSLSVGMDNIRSSIHNLHDESVDLYASINTLVKEFTFCPITFDYHLKNTPTTQLKYFFLWTIKESLSNVTKHSNATKVSIVLMEHPIMYQLIITNNGNSILDENMYLSDGIGLRTMRERTHAFKGIFQVSTEKGFRIFITIPIKNEEVVNNESTCD
ncbi:sensor histidine kinase [Alkalibaculum bacchi]|uniref:sensor histidine kinase n=1 Tax=Alkalibaculum bacchi TaxID=645887 RepID=UPI0026EC8666|nr:histidine kinase [Alkalibaculum bacchi]